MLLVSRCFLSKKLLIQLLQEPSSLPMTVTSTLMSCPISSEFICMRIPMFSLPSLCQCRQPSPGTQHEGFLTPYQSRSNTDFAFHCAVVVTQYQDVSLSSLDDSHPSIFIKHSFYGKHNQSATGRKLQVLPRGSQKVEIRQSATLIT